MINQKQRWKVGLQCDFGNRKELIFLREVFLVQFGHDWNILALSALIALKQKWKKLWELFWNDVFILYRPWVLGVTFEGGSDSSIKIFLSGPCVYRTHIWDMWTYSEKLTLKWSAEELFWSFLSNNQKA